MEASTGARDADTSRAPGTLFYYYTNIFLNKDFVYDYQHRRIYRSIQLQGQFHIGLPMSPLPGSLATH